MDITKRVELIYFDEKSKKYFVEEWQNEQLVSIKFYDNISAELMPLVRNVPSAQDKVTSVLNKPDIVELHDTRNEFVFSDKAVWATVIIVSFVILATAAPMIINTMSSIAEASARFADKGVVAIKSLFKFLFYLLGGISFLVFLYYLAQMILSARYNTPHQQPPKPTRSQRVVVGVVVETENEL